MKQATKEQRGRTRFPLWIAGPLGLAVVLWLVGSFRLDGAQRASAAAVTPPAQRVQARAIAQGDGARGLDQGAASGTKRETVSSSSAEQQVNATVSAMTALLHEKLRTLPAYARADACRSSATRQCSSLISDALYEIWSIYVSAEVASGSIDVAGLNKLPREAVRAAIGATVSRSSDPVARVAALIAATDAAVAVPRLPREAYADLADKPVIEAQLLLQHHRGKPLDQPEVVRDVASLASSSDGDPRVQGAALSVLAQPATATELVEAVRTLDASHSHDWEGWFDSVAPAVGRCGLPCLDAIEVVLGPHPRADLAGEVLRSMPRPERAMLLEHLNKALSADVIARLAEESDALGPD